ncbi:HAD family hydrolase [Thermodesulfobacteriota bacterium]
MEQTLRLKDIIVVAFDCDGVMFDTTRANMAYYNRILSHFEKPDMTPEQFSFAHMHTADETIAHLFDDEASFAAAQIFRKGMSYVPFLKYMEIEPHLKSLIERLRPRYKTAIATNRSDTMDRVITEHNLEGYFDLVVSSSDVKQPKPEPDLLLRIMEHFNIGPRCVIYVGDSELDEQAAKAAGVPFVAYGNTALSADFYIKSLKEIEDILDR